MRGWALAQAKEEASHDDGELGSVARGEREVEGVL